MIYALVCEGSCNPTRESIDTLVADYTVDTLKIPGARVVIADPLAELQRTLRYTPHIQAGTIGVWQRAECLDCGTERKYGY